MKLFKLAAILLALASVALAQETIIISGTTSNVRVADPNELLAFSGQVMKVSEYMELMGPHSQVAAMTQAQATTLQCSAFPCTIFVTADQCKTFPCALTITTGPKFTLGDKVVVSQAGPTLAVRATPASSGGLLGVQPNGRSGIVIAGPVTDVVGDHKTRWQIDYAAGVDGWSIEDYLRRTASGPPPPPVCPAPGVVANNVCTCPAPNTLVSGVCTAPPPPPVCNPPSTIVNGVCTPPAAGASMTLTPSTMDFGAPPLGTVSPVKFFTLTNTGSLPLTVVSQLGLGQDVSGATGFLYGSKGSCVYPIAVGTNCTISAKYNPAALGAVTATFTLNTNAANSPQSVAMTAGAAQAPGKSVTLTWFAPLSDGAASYNLYRGGVKVGNVVGSVLTFTDTPVPSGTYQYTATTVDSSGRESLISNSVTVVIP